MNKAFTLIELMVVIGIVAILSAIAIPAYKDYNTKARMGEVLNIANGYKADILEYYALHSIFPQSHTDLGFLDDNGYISGSDTLAPTINKIAIVKNGAANCPEIEIAEIEVILNENIFGLNNLNNAPHTIYLEIADLNSVITTYCIADLDNTNLPIEYLTGCYNADYPDFAAISAAVCAAN